MRFIVRPRQLIQEGIQLFNTAPFATLRLQLLPFGVPTPIAFLSAFSLEVNEERVDEFENWAVQAQNRVAVRRACAVYPIQDPPDSDTDPEPQVPASLKYLALQPLWDDKILGKEVNVGIIDEAFGKHDCLKRAVKSKHYYDPKKKSCEPGDAKGTTTLQKAHGTFVAALVAGDIIDNKRISVAPESNLHLVEIPGPKFEDDLILAIEFLSQTQHCRVIVISLGTWEPHNEIEAAVLTAKRDFHTLTVAGIGNSGKGVAMWPGACESTLSVGYCDEKGGLNTNSGSTLFERGFNALVPLVLAPGVKLNSADLKNPGKTCQKSGTSYSGPLIAGLAALLVSDAPCATAYNVEEAILASCAKSQTYPERCARGVPNAQDALAYLRGITAC